ncbi:T9SS type A sorting domain-containing protein [Chitinophaga agrisoli]|uniref:T9SS type A sorting domain-containing protein n=1 Tax=Chitinophaga agrisoli TaxID=2607653 RepID=A0A5B2VMP1_9BACT|nr:T9SS type A sorting domain-containing protein [Chitinophaga agrisoli]KAA2240341.1 T9SS type A sorting domain-containing protein [Chitinophaga agrisoli]
MKKQLLKGLLLLALWPLAAKSQTPPATWQEHWFEHNQIVSKVYEDNDLALYYDNGVSPAVTWPKQYLSAVWRYTKKVYGNFNTDPHLFAILHTGRYGGGHPSTYFDDSHDFRNVIDAGAGPWNGNQTDYDLLTHEVGHIVEGASKNMHNSPAFGIWGDSKWCEIFIYDVYKGLGQEGLATGCYNAFMGTTDNFPRANTAWFKNWFYPIYSQYGGADVLNRYFVQLALYFKRNGTDYPPMNMGEFVHFWSGAAGVNLKAQATIAFGWTSEFEAQFLKAQQDFPFAYNVPGATATTLFQDIFYGGYGVSLPAGRYNLTQLRAYGGRNDDITSLKVTSGYTVTLYKDDNFSGDSINITSDTQLLDGSWNDQATSLVIRSVAPVGQRIWLRGFNNSYVSSKNGVEPMWCNAAAAQGWEQFLVVDAGNSKIALQGNNGAYVSSENGTAPITCNRPTAGGWEQFDWILTADGKVTLRGNNGRFISSENGAAAMTCNRPAASGWETFNYSIITAAAMAKLAPIAANVAAKDQPKALHVYPNPAVIGNTITVKIDCYNANAPVGLELVDINKRIVRSQQTGGAVVNLSTAGLTPGVYVLVVTNGSNRFQQKVVVQ